MKNPNNLCMGCMNEKTGNGICSICGYNPAEQINPLLLTPGTLLCDRYIIGKVIDNNGEGTTYLGYDQLNDVVVRVREFLPVGLCERGKDNSLKIIEGSEYSFNEGIVKFLELSKQLFRLKDLPALLPVVDIREENKTAYCITKSIAGITLREFLLRNGGTLKWEQARPLFVPLISSFKALHDAGVVHRGISTDTLIVGKDGKIRITGFCIAEARTARSFMTAQLFPGFAAIEQYGAVGKEGTWTDVYGFAATLYRTLVGNPPPEATDRVNNDSMSIPSKVAESVPINVLEAMANALQILPEDRTLTMEELREGLSTGSKADLREKSKTDKNKTDPKGAKKNGKGSKKSGTKKYALLAALATAAVLLVIFGFLYITVFKNKAGTNTVSSLQPFPVSSSESVVSNNSDPLTKYYTEADFTGKTYAEIMNNIEYTELYTFEIVGKEYNDTYAAGKVISQSPAAGTSVLKGTKISLKISLGAHEIAVPNVIGKTQDKALIDLMKAGFEYQNIEIIPKYDDKKAPGVVIDMSPASGEKIVSDSPITIYINSYEGESSTVSSTTSITSSGYSYNYNNTYSSSSR